jgi:hypothetical protein
MSEETPIITNRKPVNNLVKDVYILGYIGPIGYILLMILLFSIGLFPFFILIFVIVVFVWY